MRRREFIAGLGGAAAWRMVARAQPADRVRRIGELMQNDETDPEAKSWLSGFTQGLSELGWTEGRNVRFDTRWASGDVDRMRMFAKELVGLQPDLILVMSTPATAALQRETRTIPIIFTAISDPVGSGFVEGLPRPGGNITGFISYEASLAGKWLQLLTEIAPGVRRAAAIFNPNTAPINRSYYLPSFEQTARSLQIEPITALVHSDAEIAGAITSIGREPGGGLVVMPDSFMVVHRMSTISLAAQNSVPAVYWHSVFARDGGLLAYGSDFGDLFRRAAAYADRILRGGNPTELPVQVPTKFEMAVNLKTANALGLTVPQSILLRADEVIE
jgi:putative ABC transport system substrate-binding protein